MTIKIIAPSVCLMLLLSISGVAQEQDESRQFAKGALAKATAPEANTQEPGLFDAEIQRESKDLLARQRAEAPAGRNPFSSRANNQGRANLAPAGIANRTQATSRFAPNMFGAPQSKLGKINQETASGIDAIVKKIKKSEDDEEKQELKNEIQQLLDAQYDAYLNHHEEPLKQLEERLIKLRDEFEARKKAKADLVKLRLDTVWYDAIGLGWPSNANGAAGFSVPGYQNQSAFAPSAVWQVPSDNRALSPRTNTLPALPPPPGLAVPYRDGTQPAVTPKPPKSDRQPPVGDHFGEPDRPSPPTRPRRSGGR